MNTPAEAAFNIQDMPALFSKHRWLILLSTFCSGVFFVFIAHKLPKKYKAHVIVTISSKYFQSPLIGDIVPGLSESGDSLTQRDSLVRTALTPEFVQSLGEKYGIIPNPHTVTPVPLSWIKNLRTELKTQLVEYGLYEPPSKESQITEEYQDLRAHIDIFALNNTTFNIGFIYSDPAIAFQATQDLYNQVVRSLLEYRTHTLVNVRDAIQKRLESLSANLPPPPTAPGTPAASPSPAAQLPVEEELRQVRSQIKALSAQYTEEHPLVQQLRDRERTLVRWQNASAPADTEPVEKPSMEGRSAEASRDIYGDLMKKLNYLNIAIESDQQHQADYFAVLESPMYPAFPLFPKVGLFALWGLAVGFFGSLFLSALMEYFDRSTLHTRSLAQQLGLPLLGELPNFPAAKSSHPPLLLGAPPKKTPGLK